MKFNKRNFFKLTCVAFPLAILQALYPLPICVWGIVCIVVGFIMPPVVEFK